MIYVILPKDAIGEVMRGERTTLPVTYPADPGTILAIRTEADKRPTCLVDITACDEDPEGFTLTIKPHVYEHQPLLLRSGSPLTGGGKARLMSARKRRPGKAKAPGGQFTDAQATGYTENPALALRDAGEAVDPDTLERFSFIAALRHEKTLRATTAQARRDRELLTIEQRMAKAREAARLNYVDVSGDLDLVRKYIRSGRSEQSVARRLEAAERVAYRDAA